MSLRYACRVAIALLAAALPNSARADQSGAATLAPHTFLNLETGAASGSGGDILWDGAALRPQGRAGLYNLGKYGLRAFRFIHARSASSAPYSSAPIPRVKLVAGDVFGVKTNGGHYAKVMVTAASGVSLSLKYTTFGATGSATTRVSAAGPLPTITKLQNTYSSILPGLPNYGIAPGSSFVIFGSGLGSTAPTVTQSSAPPGLPTTLNQTSVSVIVNGVTTMPALSSASANSVAAVLPSTTPVGIGTITVTYNGQASTPAPIQVVASAIGLATADGSGNGAGVFTDTSGAALGLTNSAMPGQAVILRGSGIGADPGNDDRTSPQNQNNLTNIPTQFYIGGIPANILYAGRSQEPGIDQFNVVVPPNVSPGCFVSVVAMTGSIVSNNVTLPVDPSGGPCSDPASGLSGSQLQSLANKGSVNSAVVSVGQFPGPNGAANSAALVLAAALSGANFGKGYEYASQGSCTIVPPEQGSGSNVFQSPLDVGTIQLTGPAGQSNLGGTGMGLYQSQLPGSATASPGPYTFTSSGGADVGSFTTSINLSGAPLTLTNQAALASIARSQGATVTWSGGFSNGDVQIEGTVGDQYGSVRFFCHAPSSAGQFAIPPSILMAMPPGGGNLVVTNYTAPLTVSATGLDVGLAAAIVTIKLNSNFK